MGSPADSVKQIVAQWGDRLPDLDASPLLVWGRLERVVARADGLLRPPFAQAGLASGDFDVLAALRRADPPHALAPGDLAAAMLVTAGAATKRIDRLEAAGLVTRTRAADDGRGRVVTLTGAGIELTDRLIRAHLANEDRLLAALSPDERETLAALLSTLLGALENPAPTNRS